MRMLTLLSNSRRMVSPLGFDVFRPSGRNGETLWRAFTVGLKVGFVAGLAQNAFTPIKTGCGLRAEIADDKIRIWLFGRSTANKHSLTRSLQNKYYMKQLGLDANNPQHINLLQKHFEESLKQNNIIKTQSTKWGNFEARESLFAGPSGKFAVFETQWQVMPKDVRRLITVIPKGHRYFMKIK